MESMKNGTGMAVSPALRAALCARAERLLEQRAAARFRELVLAWAASDEDEFPTREQAEDEARQELEVLCGGLGLWATLSPEEVFPLGLIPAQRLLPRDEEWWW